MSARILIIEDEAIVAMELRFVLEDLGYQVVGTRCGSPHGA
jgi:CheY-like chemotaxis protein